MSTIARVVDQVVSSRTAIWDIRIYLGVRRQCTQQPDITDAELIAAIDIFNDTLYPYRITRTTFVSTKVEPGYELGFPILPGGQQPDRNEFTSFVLSLAEHLLEVFSQEHVYVFLPYEVVQLRRVKN